MHVVVGGGGANKPTTEIPTVQNYLFSTTNTLKECVEKVRVEGMHYISVRFAETWAVNKLINCAKSKEDIFQYTIHRNINTYIR